MLPNDWARTEKEKESETEDAVFNITLFCRNQAGKTLLNSSVAQKLFGTIAFRNQQKFWKAYMALLMPDHIHLLVSFPNLKYRKNLFIEDWKLWSARHLGLEWESGYWEYRLRDGESIAEKANDILAHPVLAGLVFEPQEWQHVWFGSEKLRLYDCLVPAALGGPSAVMSAVCGI